MHIRVRRALLSIWAAVTICGTAAAGVYVNWKELNRSSMRQFVDLMTYFVAWFVYKTSGPHYLSIASTHMSNTFNEKCLSWYLEYGSKYVTEQNVKNATFVLTLIVSLSLLDIAYRVVCKFGSLMPVTMVYDFRHVIDDHKRIILEAWRFYAKEFNPPQFIELVEARTVGDVSPQLVRASPIASILNKRR
jgi:hypothetical protein